MVTEIQGPKDIEPSRGEPRPRYAQSRRSAPSVASRIPYRVSSARPAASGLANGPAATQQKMTPEFAFRGFEDCPSSLEQSFATDQVSPLR